MKKIFCIGQATYDITLPIEEYPKENTKTKYDRKVECTGGSALNVALLLSKWNEKVSFVGAVGDDIYGRKVKNTLKVFNINTKYLSIKKGNYTATSYILANTKNGKRSIFTYRDNDIKSYSLKFTSKPDILYFDGNDLDIALKAIEKYPDALKIIDAGGLKDSILKLGPMMDYFVCSKNFAEEYTNLKIDSKNIESIKKAYKILEKEFKNVVITLEAAGSFAKINNRYKLVPSIQVKSIDSTGAGDMYHGAFTYFISKNYDLEKAMYLSNVVGALTTTKIGTRYSIPPLKEVLEYDR